MRCAITVHEKGPFSEDDNSEWYNDVPSLTPNSHSKARSDETGNLDIAYVLRDKLILDNPMAALPKS